MFLALLFYPFIPFFLIHLIPSFFVILIPPSSHLSFLIPLHLAERLRVVFLAESDRNKLLNVCAVPVPCEAAVTVWLIWQRRERKRYTFRYGHCPEGFSLRTE